MADTERAPTIEERMNSYLAETEPEKYAEPEVAEASEAPVVEPEVIESPEAAAEATEIDAAETTVEAAEEATEDDAVTIAEISELAEHIGADVADLYQLAVPTTGADGAKLNVTLGELKDAYQESQKASKLTKQAQEEYEALNKQRIEFEASIQSQAAQTKSYLEAANAELTRDFQNVNWDQLRIDDPGKYAVTRQDFIERQARLQNIGQQAAQQWDEQQAQLKTQREEQFGQYAMREQAALFDAIPEWRDTESAKAEQAKVSEYLLSTGYTQDEIQNAYDHRAIVLARKAMMWDEQQKKVPVDKKRVLKIGKRTLKPGARQSKAQQTNDRAQGLRQNLRKSGKVQDAVALYEALGG